MTPDLINGLFELLGGAFILNHCRAVWRDKAVAGVSIVSTAFFSLWGVWNLFYYPHLGQWYSFAGGIAIVCGNVLWIALLLRYAPRLRSVAEAQKPNLPRPVSELGIGGESTGVRT